MGFTPTGGELVLYLGGIQKFRSIEYGNSYLEDIDNIRKVKWTGHFTLNLGRNEPKKRGISMDGTYVFRDGKLKAIVEKSGKGTGDLNTAFYNYYDQNGKPISEDVVQPTNVFYAASDALNQVVALQ